MTKLPVLQCGAFVVAELEPIIHLVEKKGVSLTSHLDADEKQDLRAYLCLTEKIFTNAEVGDNPQSSISMEIISLHFYFDQLYICWLDKQTLQEITCKRYGSVYPWPLNHIQNWRKRRHIENKLKVFNWASYTSEQVVKKVRKCCVTLTEKLGPNKYFYGDTYVRRLCHCDFDTQLYRFGSFVLTATVLFNFSSPTELDALVFGHIFTILTTPLPNSDLQQMIKNNFRPLVEFCDRIEKEFFKK